MGVLGRERESDGSERGRELAGEKGKECEEEVESARKREGESASGKGREIDGGKSGRERVGGREETVGRRE